jgi:DNA-binding NarL/FixJ family response regulator
MMNVLIVDDSRVARLSLRRMISATLPEATILEAGGADEAMAVAADNSIKIAIIDYNMPNKTGLDLAEMLSRTSPRSRLALCTANIQDALAERARKMGMTFIPKPPDAALLASFLKGETP